MRAVTVSEPGGPEVLTVTDLADPSPGAGEVVLDMVGTAVNRADTLQRQGLYPPPPGASDILGLECSGVISSVGPSVSEAASPTETQWSVGDAVCGLHSGRRDD